MGRYSGANAMWRGRRLAELERRADERLGVLMDLEEPIMLEPFADFGEPPEELRPLVPDELVADEPPEPGPEIEPEAQDAPSDGISQALSDELVQVGLTPVDFPVLLSGGHCVDFSTLLEPSRRVAELVEAIYPVLVPPQTIAGLEALVTRAVGIAVTDAGSYEEGCEVYELLAANEKGIEETISPVVAFFHRPWKAMTDFRARFAKPVADQKKRLSDDCAAWKRADLARAERERRAEEDRLAAEERQKLETIAQHAEQVGQPVTAAIAREAAAEVVRPTLPLSHFSTVPRTAPKGRTNWVGEVTDEDAFYKGLADGTIPRAAAPIADAWLNGQAKALKQEMAKRYPGTRAYDKGGLTASGKR